MYKGVYFLQEDEFKDGLPCSINELVSISVSVHTVLWRFLDPDSDKKNHLNDICRAYIIRKTD